MRYTEGMWRDRLDSPRLPLVAALLAVLLALPSATNGLIADDWFHRAHFDPPDAPLLASPRGALLDLFTFFPADPALLTEMMDAGYLPWWTDPAIRGSFLRPVSAATHLVDWRVFGGGDVLAHLHSLLWLFLLVLAVGGAYRAWLGGRAAALATLLFAVDDAHAWPSTWLANRNALVAGTFGALAVWAHLALPAGWRRGVGPLCFGLALLSAEAGVATAAFLLAVELGRGPVRESLGRAAPYLVVGVAWAVAWKLGGYGIQASGLYVDPLVEPLHFLALIPERVGALSAAAWLNLPVDGWLLLPGWLTGAAGVLLGLLTAGAVYALSGGFGPAGAPLVARQAVFLAVVGLVPSVAAFPMERVTQTAGIGVFAFLSVLLTADGGLATWRNRLALLWHGPLAAVLLAVKVIVVPAFMADMARVIDAVPDEPALPEHELVIVGGMEIATAYIPIARALEGRPTPARLALLAPAASAVRVTREADRVLRLDHPKGMFRHAVEGLCRGAPLPAGTTVQLPSMRVEVLTDDGDGHPTSVRFEFAESADSPRYLWLAPRGGEMLPWSPPPVGEAVDVEALLPLPG